MQLEDANGRMERSTFPATPDIYYLHFWTDNAPNVSLPGALQSRLAFSAESTNVERQLGINYLLWFSLVASFHPSCISAAIIRMSLAPDYSD